jgi:2,3,4,5-tetrahydropyridine-2-carboxylate N-succinyltransferase
VAELNAAFAADLETLYKDIADGKKKVDELSSHDISLIEHTVAGLDQGQIRVAEKINGQWTTHQWIKKGILLFFRLRKIVEIHAGDLKFLDKIPLKNFLPEQGVRVVPSALARYGCHIEAGAILMPSYVNIGARVGTGSMVDTWATVGSCAQIGKGVHLSGGVGIGGVLEPIQANPVIVEDHAFIGSRCIVVEGALIEEGAVLGAGVTITGSTKIIDVTNSEAKTYTGLVPAHSVVIPGTYQKKYPAGEFGVPCALIIGKRKASTDLKTSLTEALRDFNVSV